MIERAATKLQEAVGKLEGFKDSRRELIELRELEDEGDRLNREAIAELFASSDGRDLDHPLEGHPRAARGSRRRVRERGGRVGGDSRQEPLSVESALLVITVVVALGFDFTNGFHDTANAVATSVSTRALSPRLAVLIASIANLAGAFVTTAVATTVGKGIIDTNLATTKTVLAALVGAIAWNLLTWWFGLPSSSSHALIGGLIGAALVQSGAAGVEWHGIAHKVVIPAVVAPRLAFAAAFLLLLAIYWIFRWMTPGVANRTFRLGQLGSGTWVAFTHGVERRAEDDGRDRARALRATARSTTSTSRPG